MSYVFSLGALGGQTTSPYTFLSLFNPSGTGRVMILHHYQVSPYAVSETTSATPILFNRITAASGGTSQSASVIFKTDSEDPDPVAEVRTENPTTTSTAAAIRVSPPIQPIEPGPYAPATQTANFLSDQWGPILLREGEGVEFRQTSAGNVNQRWPFLIVWSE